MLLLLGPRYGLAAAGRLCGRRPCKAARKNGGAGGVARVAHVIAAVAISAVVCGLLALAVLLPAAAFSSLLVLPWRILVMLRDHGFATSGWQRHIGSRLRGSEVA